MSESELVESSDDGFAPRAVTASRGRQSFGRAIGWALCEVILAEICFGHGEESLNDCSFITLDRLQMYWMKSTVRRYHRLYASAIGVQNEPIGNSVSNRT